MLDVTIGPVISIIDGNTFTMNVTRIGTHNKFTYREYETVRIANTTASNLSSVQGIQEKQRLYSLLSGKIVRCEIYKRDQYNVLIAEFKII